MGTKNDTKQGTGKHLPGPPEGSRNQSAEAAFLSRLSAPARLALTNAGITTLKKLATLSRQEILSLHGMGPASIPKLREALKEKGLCFRDEDGANS